jgi:hypothetical protein
MRSEGTGTIPRPCNAGLRPVINEGGVRLLSRTSSAGVAKRALLGALTASLAALAGIARADGVSASIPATLDWHLLLIQTLNYAKLYVPFTAIIALVLLLVVLPRLIKHWTRDYKPFTLKAPGYGAPIAFAATRLNIRIAAEIRPVHILAVGFAARKADSASDTGGNGLVRLIDCRTRQVLGQVEMPDFVNPQIVALGKHPNKPGEGFMAVSAGIVGNTAVYVYALSGMLQHSRKLAHEPQMILHRDHFHQPSTLAIGSDGSLAVGDVEGAVTIYRLTDPVPSSTQTGYSHPGEEDIKSISFNPNPKNSVACKIVASASANCVQRYDLVSKATFMVRRSSADSKLKFQQVVFSPNGEALAILSTSPDNAAEITVIQHVENQSRTDATEGIVHWRSIGADQVVFAGPEWDALVTRDRPSGQSTGGRIWNMPEARACAPADSSPLIGAPEMCRYLYHIYPGQYLLFIDSKGTVTFKPEREAAGTSATALMEDTPLYELPGTKAASDTATLTVDTARHHARRHRYEMPVTRGQIWGFVGAILMSLVMSFAAACVNLSTATSQTGNTVAGTRHLLLRDILAKARDGRQNAIAYTQQASKSKSAKDKRKAQTKARQQWAKVDAVVSLYDQELKTLSQEARSQNRAIREKQANAPHDKLDSVGEVLLLAVEAKYGQGIPEDAESIVASIKSDYDRAIIPSVSSAKPIRIAEALQQRLPNLYRTAARSSGKQRARSKPRISRRTARTRKPPRHRRSSSGRPCPAIASSNTPCGTYIAIQ